MPYTEWKSAIRTLIGVSITTIEPNHPRLRFDKRRTVLSEAVTIKGLKIIKRTHGSLVSERRSSTLNRSQTDTGTLKIRRDYTYNCRREPFRIAQCTFQMSYLQALSRASEDAITASCFTWVKLIGQLPDGRQAYTSRASTQP